jgi:hypothetical protein
VTAAVSGVLVEVRVGPRASRAGTHGPRVAICVGRVVVEGMGQALGARTPTRGASRVDRTVGAASQGRRIAGKGMRVSVDDGPDVMVDRWTDWRVHNRSCSASSQKKDENGAVDVARRDA